jgi:hypothetical protein
MDDAFFSQNTGFYTGVTIFQEEEFDVSALLSNLQGGASCRIVLDTWIPGFGPVTGALSGPISPDGTTCNFAGTSFVLTDPISIPLPVVSGTATLSNNGQTLTFSDIVFINPQTFQQQTIPGVVCNCS